MCEPPAILGRFSRPSGLVDAPSTLANIVELVLAAVPHTVIMFMPAIIPVRGPRELNCNEASSGTYRALMRLDIGGIIRLKAIVLFGTLFSDSNAGSSLIRAGEHHKSTQ